MLTRAQVEHICKNVRDIGHLAWEARVLEDHDAKQRQTIEALNDDVTRLNNVLRNIGWGQGEIDSAACLDENIDKLKQTIDAQATRIGELEEQLKNKQYLLDSCEAELARLKEPETQRQPIEENAHVCHACDGTGWTYD